MIDPASAADWVQASLVAGLVAGLAATATWALAQEQQESSAASPSAQAAANDDHRLGAAVEERAG